MLQQMRTFAKSWVASVFLLLVVGSFTLWGVADVFRGGTDTDVVSMSSTSISYDQFNRDYRNVLKNESMRAGRDISSDEARKAGMPDLVLQQMINRTALDKLAADMGLMVGDDDVAARARQIDAFKGPLGTFDKRTFDNILQQRGYTEAEFVSSMRADMTRSQLLSPVQSGFEVPPGYAHALFDYFTEMRAVDYVVLTAQMLGAPPAPTDQQLGDYIKAHAARFSTPEYRSVSVAALTVDDASAGMGATDKELHNEYETHKGTYIVPERRDVQQVTFADEASAKAAADKIKSGTSFEMAAAQAGKTIDDRNAVSQEDLGPTLGAAVFALPQDGVSAPLKNFASWVLMRVKKITPGKSVTFDQAKDELTKSIVQQKAMARLGDVSNLYQDSVSQGDDIATAAKKAGMKLFHVAAIDAQGFAPDGSKPAQMPVDPELLQHIFAAEAGEPGDPFNTTQGTKVYGIAVQGVTPPHLKSLDAARADATRVWTTEQNFNRLRARAAELAAQARRDGNLDGIAKTIGSPVLNGGAMPRSTTSPIFSAPLTMKIFAAPGGSVVFGAGGVQGGFIVARVSGITHPPMPPTDPRYRAGLQQISQQVGEDITDGLAKAQRAKMNVKVNQKLLNQAVGGESGS
ncbi:MAG TPA: SurA N-terminal domain-containing protein [Rhizomicrobium sp.]|nr:SurA N-terminal domain-containing protein [Rhizomicrobium sp.]